MKRSTMVALGSALLGGGVDPAIAFIEKLKAPTNAKNSTLHYISSTRRTVWTPADNEWLWTAWTLDVLATGFWALMDVKIYNAVHAVAVAESGITYSGTWTTSVVAGGLGGNYRFGATAGHYAEFSFTGGDKLYISYTQASNGGYANVTIDGSTALVNELPGAQLNSYKSGSLVAGNRILIASGLNPSTTYTVRITATGTKEAASSGTRFYLEAGFRIAQTINSAQVYNITGAITAVANLGATTTTYVWEYAILYKPTGASAYEWTGSGHLNEVISTVTWKDGSGNDISVSVGTPRNDASSVVLEMTGTSRHSQTSTTNHANVTVQSTFSTEGLSLYHRHNWLSTATIDKAYPAMYPVANAVNRGMVAGDASKYVLTSDDGSFRSQSRSRALACWTTATNYVAWMYLPDFSAVGNWAKSANYAFIEDRSGGGVNKMYLQRVGGTPDAANDAIANGDVWESTAYYRATYFADPDTNL